MARYGQAFKNRAVARLLPPESASLDVVSREVGVSADTLERWRSEALAQPAQQRTWTAAARLEAVITTAALDEVARNAWCREHGVYPQELAQWRSSATQALAAPQEARASPQQTKDDRRRNAITATTLPAYDQSFGYDELGRLTGITTSSATWSLGYDANGNRTVVTTGGTTRNYTTATTSNRLNALTNPARSFTYDNAGNTTADTGNAYTSTYDVSGRMATLTKAGVTTTYGYNGDGRRVRKFSSSGASSTVIFVYDQAGHLLGEYSNTGAALREYVWMGDTPVAVFTPDPANAANPPLVYYIHADHLDTPRVVLSQANQLRWRWMAEPFGTTAPETNPQSLGAFTFNLRFPGQYADVESGLNYNYFRDYDASVGRYVQSDPIGLAGGINTYSYVEGNPLSFVDAAGLAGGPPAAGVYYPRGTPPRPIPRSDLAGRAAQEAAANMGATPNPSYPGDPLDLPCVQWYCPQSPNSCGRSDVKGSNDFLPPAVSTAGTPTGCRCMTAGRDPAFQRPFDPNVDPFGNARDVQSNWKAGWRLLRRP